MNEINNLNSRINLVYTNLKNWLHHQKIWAIVHRLWLKQLLKWMMISIALFVLLGSGILYGYTAALVKDEPIRSYKEIVTAVRDRDITGYVYFNDHSLLGELKTMMGGSLTTIDEIPKQIIDAFVATEDSNFEAHFGIDIMGTMRAIKQKLTNSDDQTGGSTITQQLARRVFLSLDQTMERKAAEILLAMRMEQVLPKEDILLAYLTKIYFGRGAQGDNLYGIKSAANGIFDKEDLTDLNLAQMAYLAGLPQQPNRFSAFDRSGEFDQTAFENAIQRQQLVLKRMMEEELITKEQFASALVYDIQGSLAQTKELEQIDHLFLMTEVKRRASRELLKLKYPNIDPADENYSNLLEEVYNDLQSKGYKIYTTIDPLIHHEMKLISQNPELFTSDDPEKGMEQIGAMMIENQTGAIVGMIAGRDFNVEQLNHATQMVRQPGSAFKPIAAYLPALEMGLIQPGSIMDDVPIILESGGGRVHLPENWDQTYHGLITAREALKWSYNIPALKLFNYEVGIEKAWEFVRKLGISTITEKDNQAKTGVIGGLSHGVTVEELTNAYAAIGNQGIYHDAYIIERIENAQGEVIYNHKLDPQLVFSEQTAYLMTDMMRSSVESGTGTKVAKDFNYSDEIAFVGKTGTSQDNKDVWFVGYTPELTLGVWAGYDDYKHELTKSNCSETAGCGTSRAKNIWAEIMNASVKKNPDLFVTKEFERPEGIVTETVSRYSGMLPSEEIRKRGDVITDIFNQKYIPTEVDSVAGKTSYVIYEDKKYLAQATTPKDMVFQSFLVQRERPISLILQEIKAIPADERKALSHYVPVDAELDGPTELDPRQDDGEKPEPPSKLTAKKVNDSIQISFQLNSEQDVIGYRLYRSVNGGKFRYVEGKAISSQEEAFFTDDFTNNKSYIYVITAVDVAGNESENSNSTYIDNNAFRDWFSDFFKNN